MSESVPSLGDIELIGMAVMRTMVLSISLFEIPKGIEGILTWCQKITVSVSAKASENSGALYRKNGIRIHQGFCS